MAQNFFNDPGDHVGGEIALAADVNERFGAVADGFAKLPDPYTSGGSLKGFAGAVTVGNATNDLHAVSLGYLKNYLEFGLPSGTIGYSPEVSANWDPVPDSVSEALDILAAKVAAWKQSIVIPLTNFTDPVATGTSQFEFPMPYNFTLSSIKASLKTPQSSGAVFTLDVLHSGSSVFLGGGNKLTIDNEEKHSSTATVSADLDTTALLEDAILTFNVEQIGNGTAIGLSVTLNGFPA